VAQEFAKDPRTVMVYHKYMYWDSRESKVWDSGYFAAVSGDVLADRRKLLAYCAASTSSLAFRRNAFEPLTRIPSDRAFSYDTYLISAALFLGPVACVPEVLTKNRVHGNNRWEAGQDGPGPATLRRRSARWGAMIEVLRDWINANAPESVRPQARVLLRRWTLVRENIEFGLTPPGRIKFFLYQLRMNQLTPELHGPKMRAIKQFNAFASLLTGYKHAGALDAFWRRLDQAKEGLTSLLRRTTAREETGTR
jgi:hypothetical protein